MGESVEAYHQFNCDNHITESAYKLLQDTNAQLEKVKEMVKWGFKSQVHSACRKNFLKALADKWMRKYYSWKNVLEIKFATYNYDACVALMKDYPMVMKLAKRLKDDTTVAAKKKDMMKKLYKHMKDGRVLMNLMAAINVLEIISDYQKWGQREKACAFERKIAMMHLETEFASLNTKDKVVKMMKEHFEWIDFESGWMKIGQGDGDDGLKEKIAYLQSMTTHMMVRRIVKRQTEMANQFLTAKKHLHEEEDPGFLSDLSDIFDLRLWKMTAFDVDNSIIFESEIQNMKEKLMGKTSLSFFNDLNTKEVLIEFDGVIRVIYAQMHIDDGILASAREKQHIIDQWICLIQHCPMMDEKKFPLWIRLVKRSAESPNAQTGTERSNSRYAMAKTKLQCRQSDEVTLARVRSQENRPPLSMFKPLPVRKLWLMNGHKYAEKVKSMEKSIVLERRRADDAKNYKSKIFL